MMDTTNVASHNWRTLGLARIPLRSLRFNHTFATAHRPISERNVQRLVSIFRTEGCHRMR